MHHPDSTSGRERFSDDTRPVPQPDQRTEPAERASILFVDPDAADVYLPSLRTRFEVSAVSSEEQALRALRAFQPTLVITELSLREGDGLSVCRHSKASAATPPSVLAITDAPERVPDVLLVGCDGVLLKPFAPNLLCARVGRLLGLRAKAIRERAMWQRAKAYYPIEHSYRALGGTNMVWHDAYCPSCGRGDCISFDAASHRRMWYACLSCRTVWMARRREDLTQGGSSAARKRIRSGS
jgi:CheY-like chemotaxis protein